MITVNFAASDLEKSLCYAIRNDVFVKEQGIAQELDTDGLDKTAEHLLAYHNKDPAGCARIRRLDSKIKLERIATLKDFRGQGVAKELIYFVLDAAQERGCQGVFMNSQAYLKEFYEKLGFEVESEPFIEVGVEHIKMYKLFDS